MMKNTYLFMFRTKDNKRIKRKVFASSEDNAWKNADDMAYDMNCTDYQLIKLLKKAEYNEN